MKSSGLLIGLGVGLLVGAAIGVYLASSEEDKAEFVDNVNETISKAKQKIGKMVNDGLEAVENHGKRV